MKGLILWLHALLTLLAVWGGERVPFDLPADPLISSDYNFEVIDRWAYGPGFSVLLDSATLFYTNGAVLDIGEVSSQGKVIWLSEYTFQGMAYNLARSGERLYVAVDDQGVAVLDVSSLDNPQELNLFYTGGRVFDIAVRNDTLYAAMGSLGLVIYDCTDASNPHLLGQLSGFRLRSLGLRDQILYATDIDIGLVVLNVSDPENPKSITGLELSGQHYGLALDTLSSQVWVCSFDGGLNVVSVADPLAPKLLSTIPLLGAWALDLNPSLALVASWDDSVHIIDRETGEDAGALGFSKGVWPYDISISGAFGALAGFLGSWWIFNFADSANPAVTDSMTRGGLSQALAADERWIIMGMQGGSLAFFHRGDSLGSARIVELEDWPQGLLVRSDTLYVAEGWAGLEIYRIPSEEDLPSGLELISKIAFDEVYVWSAAVESGFAYLACRDSGLIIVDLSDPAAPTEAARLGFGARPISVLANQETLYVGLEESGIWIVDVKDPYHPVPGSLKSTQGGVLDMLLEDSLLFVAQALGGTAIYDVSEPDWQELSTIPTNRLVFSLSVKDDILYVAEGTAGISAYEVGNPSLPHKTGSFNTGGEARDIIALEDTILVADGYDGIIALKFLGLGIDDPEVHASSLAFWPNPFSSYLYFNKEIEAELYDPSGRHRASIHGTSLDASGLAPGIYFICIKGQHHKVIKISSHQ